MKASWVSHQYKSIKMGLRNRGRKPIANNVLLAGRGRKSKGSSTDDNRFLSFNNLFNNHCYEIVAMVKGWNCMHMMRA